MDVRKLADDMGRYVLDNLKEKKVYYLSISITYLVVCTFLIYGIEEDLFKENRMRGDEQNYHVPTVTHFAEGGGIGRYPAGMSPGYHILMSYVYRLSDSSIRAVRVANVVITFVLIITFAFVFGVSVNEKYSPLLALPLIFSIYAVPPATWVLPDNISWLAIALVLLLSIFVHQQKYGEMVISALILFAVFVRQNNIWLIAPASFIFWVNSEEQGNFSSFVYYSSVISIPSIALLSFLVYTWEGLVPPDFQSRVSGTSLSSIPFFLSIFSIYYSVYILPNTVTNTKKLKGKLSDFFNVGLLAGVVASIAISTDYDPSQGRVSGLWNVVDVLPTLFGRSFVIFVGSSLGGAFMYDICKNLKVKQYTYILLASASFVSTRILNEYAYHRYFTVFMFIIVCLFFLFVSKSSNNCIKANQNGIISVLIFSILNLLVLCYKLI